MTSRQFIQSQVSSVIMRTYSQAVKVGKSVIYLIKKD